MNYFVKLSFGETYLFKGYRFSYNQELQVEPEDYEYLTSLKYVDVTYDGNKYQQSDFPIFKGREEELTEDQKVFEDLENTEEVPLTPKKPGRPKAEK